MKITKKEKGKLIVMRLIAKKAIKKAKNAKNATKEQIEQVKILEEQIKKINEILGE